MLQDPGRVDFEWNCLFEVYPYATHYAYFLRIFLAAPTVDELSDWVGWVKSRIRSLLLKVLFRLPLTLLSISLFSLRKVVLHFLFVTSLLVDT